MLLALSKVIKLPAPFALIIVDDGLSNLKYDFVLLNNDSFPGSNPAGCITESLQIKS